MLFPGKYTLQLALIAACTVLQGCAAGGGGHEKYRNITRSAGEGSLINVYEKTSRILNRYHYETVRQEESQQLIYYETNWRYRIPFDDERNRGVVEARTRLTVKARPRRAAAMAGASNMYIVQVVAENLVQMDKDGRWIQMPNTEEYKSYIKEIAKALENELRMSLGIF